MFEYAQNKINGDFDLFIPPIFELSPIKNYTKNKQEFIIYQMLSNKIMAKPVQILIIGDQRVSRSIIDSYFS